MEQIFDSDIGFASSDSEFDRPRRKLKRRFTAGVEPEGRQNVIFKLVNRQRTGHFSNDLRKKFCQTPFAKVPPHLSFCLKDIIPCCYLDGHIFMGLTACGQFLISYKGVMDSLQLRTYDFTALHRYELFFWIFRPHCLLHKYFSVCLFDDHGVDGLKTVTMTQWCFDSRVLIVHGEGDTSDNDSYVTYVRVPRLGCLECKELRDEYYDGSSPREAMLCIKCTMTVHIKYRIGESAPNFSPHINLNCPNFVLMNENTFIHAISVELDSQKKDVPSNPLRCTSTIGSRIDEPPPEVVVVAAAAEKRKSIAEEIIADFEEYETELRLPEAETSPRRIYQKLETSTSFLGGSGSGAASSKTDSKKAKENLYEFSEDNEKCEKISTFRKRCLAEKKYEFSEETLDNILPFNRIRNRVRNRLCQTAPQIAHHQAQDMHLHRSPNQGFRSPCGSPVGYRFLRSPPGFHSPNYYYQQRYVMLSPRQTRKVYAPPTHRASFYDGLGGGGGGHENNENRNSVNLEAKPERIEEPWKISCSKKVSHFFQKCVRSLRSPVNCFKIARQFQSG